MIRWYFIFDVLCVCVCGVSSQPINFSSWDCLVGSMLCIESFLVFISYVYLQIKYLHMCIYVNTCNHHESLPNYLDTYTMLHRREYHVWWYWILVHLVNTCRIVLLTCPRINKVHYIYGTCVHEYDVQCMIDEVHSSLYAFLLFLMILPVVWFYVT